MQSNTNPVMRKVRYMILVVAAALAATVSIILLFKGVQHLEDWIWIATTIPIVVGLPIAYIGISRRIEIETLNEKLAFSLSHDNLTKAATRQSLEDTFAKQTSDMAILMVDADHFKQINDTLGHSTGDKALIYLVDTMRDVVRETDVVGRFGGEEFVILLTNTRPDQAQSVAARLVYELNTKTLTTDDGPIRVTVSIGLAICHKGETLAAAIKRADEAVYAAKNAGRNQWRLASESVSMATQVPA